MKVYSEDQFDSELLAYCQCYFSSLPCFSLLRPLSLSAFFLIWSMSKLSAVARCASPFCIFVYDPSVTIGFWSFLFLSLFVQVRCCPCLPAARRVYVCVYNLHPIPLCTSRTHPLLFLSEHTIGIYRSPLRRENEV